MFFRVQSALIIRHLVLGFGFFFFFRSSWWVEFPLSHKTSYEREVGEREINILGFLHQLLFLPLVCITGEGEFSSLIPLRSQLGSGFLSPFLPLL